MVDRKRVFLPFAAILSVAAPFHPGPSHAAVSVTLECDRSDLPAEHAHELLELDYGASTVRDHFVNDDGGPATASEGIFPDQTFKATVSDNEITWTLPEVSGQYIKSTLGRLSGTRTDNIINTRRNSSRALSYQCHRWTPKHTERQF